METVFPKAYHNGAMGEPQRTAIARRSGGLDAALAAARTTKLGCAVLGLNLATGFCVGEGRCDTVLAQGLALGSPSNSSMSPRSTWRSSSTRDTAGARG